MNKGYDNKENVHLLSKCSMLKPIVGTEIDFRSSLFLKKFTIVDFPELLRPMIKILICFGFLSLFKIFINNFSNIFTFFFFRSGMFIFGWTIFFFPFCLGENIKIEIRMPTFQYDSSCYHSNAHKMKPLRNLSTQLNFFSRKTTKTRTTFAFKYRKRIDSTKKKKSLCWFVNVFRITIATTRIVNHCSRKTFHNPSWKLVRWSDNEVMKMKWRDLVKKILLKRAAFQWHYGTFSSKWKFQSSIQVS